jgi:predicted transcriptional regulator
MTIDESLKEALNNGAAIVFYQTDKGPSFGFIEAQAITDALARQEDGEDYYASGLVTAEGGDVNKAEDVLESAVGVLPGVWGMLRTVFVK